MRERLAEAIQLRETGRAKQDRAILEEARTLLLELAAAYPDDAEITFQTAVVYDNLGLERDPCLFLFRPATTLTRLALRAQPGGKENPGKGLAALCNPASQGT